MFYFFSLCSLLIHFPRSCNRSKRSSEPGWQPGTVMQPIQSLFSPINVISNEVSNNLLFIVSNAPSIRSKRAGGRTREGKRGRKKERKKSTKSKDLRCRGSLKLLLTARLLQGFPPLLPQSPRSRRGERSVPQSPGERPPPPPAATFTRQTPPGDGRDREGQGGLDPPHPSAGPSGP